MVCSCVVLSALRAASGQSAAAVQILMCQGHAKPAAAPSLWYTPHERHEGSHLICAVSVVLAPLAPCTGQAIAVHVYRTASTPNGGLAHTGAVVGHASSITHLDDDLTMLMKIVTLMMVLLNMVILMVCLP